MGHRGVGLRAGLVVVLATVGALGSITLGTASAVPSVEAGTYTITITDGKGSLGTQALHIGPACSNGSDDDLDTKIDYPADPECAAPTDSNEGPDNTPYVAPTFTVDIDAAGDISAPAANVKWQDMWQRQDTGPPLGVKDILIQFKADDVAGESVTGHLDAGTGAIDLTWRFHIQTSTSGVPGTIMIGSPTAPLTASLSSSGTGGAAFDPESLTATLVDSTIVYPGAVCANNLLLCPTMVTVANTKLGLPTKPGENVLEISGAVDRTPIVSEPPADAPDLTILKSHEGDFAVGVDGVYSLVVSNVGTAASSGEIVVVDTLPVGLGFVSGSGEGWSCGADAQVVTCSSSAAVAAGASAPAISLVVVPSVAGSVTNTAAVSGGGDTNAANNSASDSTTVLAEPPPDEPDLTILKSHEGDFTVGVDGVYSLVVSNVGTAASSGEIVVVDTLPVGLGFVSGSGEGWSCGAEAQVVTCSSSAVVAAGASAPAISLVVVPSVAGSVTNTAAVSGGGDTNELNNGASDETRVGEVPPPDEPDLELAKSHKGDFTVGVDGVYSLVVSNVGAAASSGEIVVVDTLPVGLGFVSGSGEGWSCGAEAQVVTCSSSAVVAAGASAPAISLVVLPSVAGSVTNTAAVSGGGDTNELNNGASDETRVLQPPAPNLTVDVVAPAMTVGVAATVVVKVANVGTGPTTGPVSVAIPLPVAFTLTSATGSGWSCTNSGANESVLNIACVTQAKVTPGTTLPVINVAVTPKAAGTFQVGAKVTTGGDVSTTDDTKVVDVVVAGTTTPGNTDEASELPFTGGDIGLLVTAAVAALGAGGGMVRTARAGGGRHMRSRTGARHKRRG